MSDWPILTLGDVCKKITDGAHNSPKSVVTGKPMASVKDLTRFGVDLSKARLIAEDEFDKLVKQGCKPEVGDVLIAKDGNSALDTVCTIDEELDAVLLSSVAILRPDKEKLDSDFLKYYFNSKRTIDYLKSNFISGAAIPRVVLKDFKKAEIKVPTLDKQKEISKILRALDDKIELNRQTNQTLEQIAQAIFKSWFVDFEPVKAKIKAKQAFSSLSPRERAGVRAQDMIERAAMAAISGKTEEQLKELNDADLQQLKTTAALFPDALVESELGEIPQGWDVKPLTSVAEILMGQSPKGETYNDIEEGTPLVNGPVEFGNYHTKKVKWTTAPTRLSSARDLIVCVRGSTTGRFVKSDGEYCLGRGVCAIRSKRYQPYVDYLFKSEISKLLGLTTGSTFPSWNGPVLKNYQIIRPANEVMYAFSIFLNSLELKLSVGETEIEQLALLRDALLPQLLSGDLAVDKVA